MVPVFDPCDEYGILRALILADSSDELKEVDAIIERAQVALQWDAPMCSLFAMVRSHAELALIDGHRPLEYGVVFGFTLPKRVPKGGSS